MATDTTLDLLAPVHRLSTEQYLRMSDVGILAEKSHTELIDGVVVELNAIGRKHIKATMWLNRAIDRQLPDELMLSIQAPVVLRDQLSVPEPDVVVIDLTDGSRGYPERPLLVIEVSASSLAYDRRTKARLYAQAGLAEYWIVNLEEETVEVHRGPHEGAWREQTAHRAGATLDAVAVPGLAVDVGELFAFVERYAPG